MASSLLAPTAGGCYIEDLEILYGNVIEGYSVQYDGAAGDLKHTYGAISEFLKYFCNGCKHDWPVSLYETQEQAWELAKEHLG